VPTFPLGHYAFLEAFAFAELVAGRDVRERSDAAFDGATLRVDGPLGRDAARIR
jgi:hypothetical protein